MGNLYLAYSVQVYEEHFKISKKLTDIVLNKILNENVDIFNRVINNLAYYPLLNHMKQSKNEKYSENRNLIEEFKNNDKIINELLNGIYIDDSLKKLLTIDRLDPRSNRYKKLYEDVLSVGEYKIKDIKLTSDLVECDGIHRRELPSIC